MLISRRTFMKSLAGAAAATIPFTCVVAMDGSGTNLTFSAPLTHSDWMLKPNVKWGPEGVHHMLDACKACGWSRIHWRTLDGGRANYASRIVRPVFKVEPDSSIWDPQSDAEKALYKKFFGGVSEARRLQILNDQQRYDY